MSTTRTATVSLELPDPEPTEREGTTAAVESPTGSRAKKLARFVHRISDVLLWTIVIGLIAVLWPNILAPLATKRVVLLTGPDGAFDRNLGKDLRQTYRLASPGRFWGRRFQFEDELEQHAPPLSEQESAYFAARIWALRRDVAESLMHGRIDRHQGDSLRGGLRNLQVDLAQLKPTAPSSPAVVPEVPTPAVGVRAAKKKTQNPTGS